LRPKEIFQSVNYKLFEGKIEPNDVIQGSVGDCYFLAACASLAEFEHRIKNLFVLKNVEMAIEVGAFCIRICDRGIWKNIILDDQIPCEDYYQRKPLYARNKGRELWVLLLEKAWAKNYGSYEQIDGGECEDVLHDLTAAPCIKISTSNKPIEFLESLWKEIEKGGRRNYVMTAGRSSPEYKNLGLVGGHAYSVLAAYFVRTQSDKMVQLVKLRNPWGLREWNQKWSDKDDLNWKTIPQSEQNRIGYEKKRDGIFFMDFNDFLRYFADVQICYVHDDYKYNAIEVNSSANEEKCFKVTLSKSGHYVFGVSQTSVQHLPLHQQDSHQYARVVLKVSNSERNLIVSTKEALREVFTRYHCDVGLDETITFSAGINYVSVQVEGPPGKLNTFGLSCYGVGEAKFETFSFREYKDQNSNQNKYEKEKIVPYISYLEAKFENYTLFRLSQQSRNRYFNQNEYEKENFVRSEKNKDNSHMHEEKQFSSLPLENIFIILFLIIIILFFLFCFIRGW